jgi:hypothetical protein
MEGVKVLSSLGMLRDRVYLRDGLNAHTDIRFGPSDLESSVHQ